MVGQTISHYTIVEKLGEGGMGVVYKAHDTRLDRFVALKFLPDTRGTGDADRARFLQEARAAAALNHPNICTIHGIEECDGVTFIAMEFVDGQTLREKLPSLSLPKAIDVGVQIAEGLSVAHEKGIIHRDIKPENIMIRKDGIVQVMDFGLAKLRTSEASRLTREGSTIGTARYMSPEQVQGHETDHRSDVFALGVLLYELLTGVLPFQGAHETALMYEIVNIDPAPPSSVRPELDPEVDRIVLEALQKEPDERYNSVKDIAKDLRRVKRESGRSRVSRISQARPVSIQQSQNPATVVTTPAMTSGSPRRGANLLPWIVAALFAVTAAGSLLYHFVFTPKLPSPVIRFLVHPPEKSQAGGDIPRISPDGSMLAFVASDSAGHVSIWLRPISSVEATPLAGTDDASYPFWSPDSRYLGFFQGSKLRKIPVAGGPPQTLAEGQDPRGGSWGSQGTIVFAPSYVGGITAVSEAGGTPVPVTTLDTTRHEDSHRWPEFLPDGRRFVYLGRSANDQSSAIMVGSIDGKEHKFVVAAKTQATFASGYLLYLRERTLVAQRFDESSAEVQGDAYPLAENVGVEQSRNFSQFSASSNGVLAVLLSGGPAGERQLTWFDRTGKMLGAIGQPGFIMDFSLSPDEKRATYRRIDPQTTNQDIWILDILRGTESRFTFSASREDDPTWSPDGSKVVYDSNIGGMANAFVKNSSGAGSETVVWKSDHSTYPLDWSSDGKYILVDREEAATRDDIWAVPMTGGAAPFPVIKTPAAEADAVFSPDARWIAYTSTESGRLEVFVQAFPTSEGKWQVSTNGGGDPVWGKDGKSIYYVAPDKQLMEVSVTTTGNSIQQGIPHKLFTADVDNYSNPNRFAVSRDGRFLINVARAETKVVPYTVVVNWPAELKAR